MAIFFSKQPRKNPFKEGEVMYYPIARSTSLAGEREVTELMCHDTTLNPGEARLALWQLRKAVLTLLKEGRSVSLGDWASFHVTLAADGAPTEEECTWRNIRGVRVQCRMSPGFLAELSQAHFRSIEAWMGDDHRSTGGDLYKSDPPSCTSQ